MHMPVSMLMFRPLMQFHVLSSQEVKKQQGLQDEELGEEDGEEAGGREGGASRGARDGASWEEEAVGQAIKEEEGEGEGAMDVDGVQG